MPDAKNNAKLTGDTHPPDVESDLPMQERAPDAGGQAREGDAEGRPGRGNRQAGVVKNDDTPGSPADR